MWSLLYFVWNVVPWLLFIWFVITAVVGIALAFDDENTLVIDSNWKKFSGLRHGVKAGTWMKELG